MRKLVGTVTTITATDLYGGYWTGNSSIKAANAAVKVLKRGNAPL